MDRVIKYLKEEFEGYTHRFKVKLITNSNDYGYTILDIYSDSGDIELFEDFINNKKSELVQNFEIINITTKEQDDLTTKMLDEWVNSDN